ncbi:hypothetical protein Q5P01_015330 [Channa striata]|uniref:Uncharacterized protein n=1 Tax=Channa striata TaxID=64152 RepID=A0AA88SLZ7_CHASR|nr:hypothetical protein Q5P01_015330 [Channa striata]
MVLQPLLRFQQTAHALSISPTSCAGDGIVSGVEVMMSRLQHQGIKRLLAEEPAVQKLQQDFVFRSTFCRVREEQQRTHEPPARIEKSLTC